MRKRILDLRNKKRDLWLTYTWSNGSNHGLCGHTFEVLDYYFHLKNEFSLGMLFAEDIDWETLKAAIESKYDLTPAEMDEVQRDSVFFKRPSLVNVQNILFTDGSIKLLHDKIILADKIFHFACGDDQLQENKDPKTFVLQDNRVYPNCFNSVDYKKKINFARYKKISDTKNEDILLYGTKNCRQIPDELYLELYDKYDNDFICLTSPENRPKNLPDRFQFPELPVSNLLEKFGTYVYTPVPRKFDCSPRFIAECKFYNKEVIYYNIDYWDEDKGLYWRKWDIDNDFESLFLNENDEITKILRDRIELQ